MRQDNVFAPVCHSVPRGCLADTHPRADTSLDRTFPRPTPPRQTFPQADTPWVDKPFVAVSPLQTHPRNRHPRTAHPQVTDGTHPTGMHSCTYSVWYLAILLLYLFIFSLIYSYTEWKVPHAFRRWKGSCEKLYKISKNAQIANFLCQWRCSVFLQFQEMLKLQSVCVAPDIL